MSPNSYFYKRKDEFNNETLVVGDFEFNDELYQEYLPVTITPSIRDFLWEYTEHNGLDCLYMFDNGVDVGERFARALANDACNAYIHDTTSEERLQLHEHKLKEIMNKTDDLVKSSEWRQMIGESLLAQLSDYAGPPREDIDVFRKAITDLQNAARGRLHVNACDFEAEQEWESLSDDGMDES